MTSISNFPRNSSVGEVDLIAIFQAIWKQKLIIIASMAVCGLLALIYAYAVTPEYRVTSVLRPAAINELDALNRSGVYTLPPSEALLKVGASLESYDSRLAFSGKIRNYSANLNSRGAPLNKVSRSSTEIRCD